MIKIPYDFLLANMSVPREQLEKDPVVFIPAGFGLSVKGERANAVFSSVLGEAVDLKDKGVLKTKENRYLLTWYKTEQQVTFPIGVPKRADEKGVGYHFFVTAVLKMEALEASGLPLPWRQEPFGNALCNLLSDYFIDAQGRQNGVAVLLREQIQMSGFKRNDLESAGTKEAIAKIWAEKIYATKLTIGPLIENAAIENADIGGGE